MGGFSSPAASTWMWWRPPSGIPASARPSRAQEVLYFPGGKGANQAVAAAKLGAPATLIGRLGTDAFGAAVEGFPRRAGNRPRPCSGNGRAHIPARPSSPSPVRTTPLWSFPAPTDCLTAADVAAVPLTRGDVAVSQFEIPAARDSRLLPTRPRRRRHHDSQSGARDECGAGLLDLVDILILNETELGFLTRTELHDSDDPARFIEAAAFAAGRARQHRLRDARQPRRARTDRRRTMRVPGRAVKAVDTTGAGDCFVGAVAAQLAAATHS